MPTRQGRHCFVRPVRAGMVLSAPSGSALFCPTPERRQCCLRPLKGRQCCLRVETVAAGSSDPPGLRRRPATPGLAGPSPADPCRRPGARSTVVATTVLITTALASTGVASFRGLAAVDRHGVLPPPGASGGDPVRRRETGPVTPAFLRARLPGAPPQSVAEASAHALLASGA